MTDPRLAHRRLQRLAAIEEAAARASERAFARASAELAGAMDRLQQLEALIQGASAPSGPATVGALQAGAQLRRLLQPVADMAAARLDAARAEREDSEARLRRCRARAEAMSRATAEAGRAAAEAAEHAAVQDRLSRSRKQMP